MYQLWPLCSRMSPGSTHPKYDGPGSMSPGASRHLTNTGANRAFSGRQAVDSHLHRKTGTTGDFNPVNRGGKLRPLRSQPANDRLAGHHGKK